ncbi:MAG: ABC transporter ATP-binding protein [Atopobiaceae bacterium]|nr:ABC transporter ATP-binding protein [Atopobiaceae bacterium]
MRQDETRRSCVLEAHHLDVGYDGVAVVRDVNLRVAPGQVVTLIGPNGAGKSTILKTMTGHEKPLAGKVFLAGEDLTKLTGNVRSRHLSVLLTDRMRSELLTCADVVEAGRYPYTGSLGILTAADKEKVREAMVLTKVWDLCDQDFMHLSDGQRQRVMLARAICQEPDVLVLDEPTNHLDVRYQIELLGILRQLARERRVGILMTVHELMLARRASDWLVCVKAGSVVAQGTPEEVFTPPVIDDLFDLEPGTYDVATGDVVIDAASGQGVPKAGGHETA